jgi:hypothetical protein
MVCVCGAAAAAAISAMIFVTRPVISHLTGIYHRAGTVPHLLKVSRLSALDLYSSPKGILLARRGLTVHDHRDAFCGLSSASSRCLRVYTFVIIACAAKQ